MEKGRDIPNTWGNDEISVRFWGYQSRNTVCHTRDTNMMVSRKEGRIKHKKVWPFVLWSMTFPLLLLSPAFHFIHSGHEYLAYIFHMQLVDGSCPEQERTDVLCYPRSLVSLDTSYEVNFTLSCSIAAPMSRCFWALQWSGRDHHCPRRAYSLLGKAHSSNPFR